LHQVCFSVITAFVFFILSDTIYGQEANHRRRGLADEQLRATSLSSTSSNASLASHTRTFPETLDLTGNQSIVPSMISRKLTINNAYVLISIIRRDGRSRGEPKLPRLQRRVAGCEFLLCTDGGSDKQQC
jgi:hypothetical protein